MKMALDENNEMVVNYNCVSQCFVVLNHSVISVNCECKLSFIQWCK